MSLSSRSKQDLKTPNDSGLKLKHLLNYSNPNSPMKQTFGATQKTTRNITPRILDNESTRKPGAERTFASPPSYNEESKSPICQKPNVPQGLLVDFNTDLNSV